MQSRHVKRFALFGCAAVPHPHDPVIELSLILGRQCRLAVGDVVLDVLFFPADGQELSVRCLMERAPHQLMSGELVDPEASLLPLIVEVQRVDGSGVEHIGEPFDLLWPVDVPEQAGIEAGSLDRFPRKDRLEVRVTAGLSRFKVASGYREVRHEDGRDFIVEACRPVPDDRLSDLLCPDVVLFLSVEPGIVRPEHLLVESGDRHEVSDRR